MPAMTGALGGVESRLIVSGEDEAVPPALVAVHVSVTAPSPTGVGSQPVGSMTGEPVS